MRAPLSWLEARPAWLAALTEGRASRRRSAPPPPALPFSWLSRAESRKARAGLEEVFDGKRRPPGYSLTEPLLDAARERLGRAVPIGRGPVRASRTGDVTHEALWLFDPDRPEQLFLALEALTPPLLWVPAGATAEELSAALAPYFPDHLPSRLELSSVARGFAGTETMLEATHEELENHFTMTRALDFLSWGSDYDDDPWPPELPGRVPRLALIAKLRELMAQRPTRVRSTSYRSFWSRSVVSLERHGDGWFVMQARYRPCRSAEVLRPLNEHLGADFPEDMPVDVVAALLGTSFVTARALERALEDPAMAASAPFHLLALGAVRHSDLRMAEVLRRYARSESTGLRRVSVILADWLRYDLLLHELCAVETEPRLRAELERMTAFIEPGEQPAAPSEPYASDNDDGLDDEEEILSGGADEGEAQDP